MTRGSAQANVERIMREGIAERQRGRLDEAARCFQRVLRMAPKSPEARHQLGLVRASQGRHEEALQLLTELAAEYPDIAQLHNDLALVLKSCHSEAEAVASLRRAIAIDRNCAEAHFNLGSILALQGKRAEALAAYGEAVAVAPGFAHAHYNLGIELAEAGRTDAAMASFRRAVAARPDFAEAHDNLGLLLTACGEYENAIESFSTAIRIVPKYAEAHYNLGNVHFACARYELASDFYQQAAKLRPNYTSALNNLGLARHRLGDLEGALDAFNAATKAQPDFADAYNNAAMVLNDLQRPGDALALVDRAVALEPELAEGHLNRGNSLTELGRHSEAIEAFERAIALRPDSAEAHFNAGYARLALGDFGRGWEGYEWRWKKKDFAGERREFQAQRWTGGDIRGKAILLWAEQGLGDTLQFVRYVPMVRALGAKVMLEAQPSLKSLLSLLSFPGDLAGDVVQIYARGEPLPGFDLHCPLLSLPSIFRTELGSIPGGVPYLHVPDETRRNAGALLGEPAAWKVGVAWSGNPKAKGASKRSVPVSALLPLLRTEGVRFYGLQNEVPDRERSALAALPNFSLIGPSLHGLLEVAAFLANLDLVISTDTSFVHLAGAMGKPAWVMLPYSPDFRWLLGREDTPWYPTLRLWRQERPGDWASVLQRVRTELSERYTAKG